MKTITHIILSGLCLPFLSCESDINLDSYRNPEVEKTVVINSIVNPDSIIEVSASHPYFFSDIHKDFSPIKNLEIKLFINGVFSGQMIYDGEKGTYSSGLKPEEGDVVEISVSDSKKGYDLSACDTIPAKVRIENVTVMREGPIHIYWDNDYRYTYSITFSDPANEKNYYFLSVEKSAGSTPNSLEGEKVFSDEYVFLKLAEIINSSVPGWSPTALNGLPFSDSGIDGKTYTLTVKEILQNINPWYQPKDMPRDIRLYSISQSYYNYMVSILAGDFEEDTLHGTLLGIGLGEPSRIFSNVKGGAGILGCYSLDQIRIDLIKETGQFGEK